MTLSKFSPVAACLLARLLVPGNVDAQAPQFTIQDLGSLPNLPACNGTALSQSGNVVGYCGGQIGLNLLNNPTTHAFLYSGGAMKDLNVDAQPTALATGVNDAGVVVGGYFTINQAAETGSTSGFIYQNGSAQSLPGQLQGVLPFALNNAGQYVGSRFQIGTSSLNFFIDSSAYLGQVTGGSAVQLATPAGSGAGAAFGISSTGEVAGASVSQNGAAVSPLLWENSTPQALPLLSGYLQASADSVNDSGVAAGLVFDLDFSVLMDPTATSHAVIFNNGIITDLGVLQGDLSSVALGINNSGAVVGFSNQQRPGVALQLTAILYPPANNYRAFLYTGGKMYDLNTLLVNATGWQLSFAAAINNAGQITGTGLYKDANGNTVQRAFLLTPFVGPAISNIVGAAFSTPAVTTISPNGLFTIFGTQLAAAQTFLTGADIVDNEIPTNLGGTCVESNGTKWAVNYVAPGQVNALAGSLPASGTVPVTVVTNCGTANEVATAAVNVSVAPESPEFLYFLENTDGINPVAAVESNYSYVGTPGLIPGATFAPAKAGDTLTAYGVGWGPTTSAVPIGTLASSTSLATLTSTYTLTLGGVPVDVLFAGLSPTYAGLYQVNFIVPKGLSAGNQDLVLTVNGVSTSPTAYIAITN